MRTLVLVSIAAILTACASSRHEGAAAYPDEIPTASGFSALTLIPTDNPSFAWRALAERAPAAISTGSADEAIVQEACNAREPRGNGKESQNAVLAPAADQAVSWQPALADAEVETAMHRFASVYSQNARRAFYVDPERRNLEPAWRCFRFTRFATRDDAEPALDFVGQLRLGDSGDYVQVRPLRLYVAAASQARGLAIGLRLEAVWRQGNLGKQETVFEPLLLARWLPSGSGDVQYFSDKYWEHYPILPLAPISTDTRGRLMQTAPATVTVTVAEIREPERAEARLLRIAQGAGDALGRLIVSALSAR